MTPREHLRVAAAEYERFGTLATGLDPERLGRPTGLPGWRVADLVEHVRRAQLLEAAALGEPAPAAADDLRAARAAFARAVERLGDPDPTRPVELVGGVVVMEVAAPLIAAEAAIHVVDLARALGGPGGLGGSALASCAAALGPMLTFVGGLGAPEPEETSVELAGRLVDVRLRRTAGRWRPDRAPGPASVRFAGDDDHLVLLGFGRGGAERLTVTGDRLLATRFKTAFPGP
ncbi:maleylpyruvate isomerase family mycothiol-dependent enzyme [Nocardioides soli]|uniref:Uncharacterized protein (TIGR03083 family) n=1 Tax=Nocardioides soli TaxID=1036020 RepID=A0A7W4VXA2_9ACTN|nr:maleylpyruvate isomerase family mycothiol-dependent enzyme [Nocardioides soli]MBB3043479.1 uncharacterized protein (TIGR03083 family) [Nocardioides soli]